VIRAATLDDVDAVLAVHAPITGLTAARARELVTAAVATGDVLVEESRADGIVGFVLVSASGFFGRDFVKLLAVSSSARRRAVGTSLLAAAVARARTARVFTSTNESNVAMRALLARQGWTLSGTLTGLDDGDDEVVYYLDAAAKG